MSLRLIEPGPGPDAPKRVIVETNPNMSVRPGLERAEALAKNILVFADGTGNDGGLLPDESRTNVYKLFRATRNGPDSSIDPRKQVAFYVYGIGTPTPGGSPRKIRQTFEQMLVAGSAAGLRTAMPPPSPSSRWDCLAYWRRSFQSEIWRCGTRAA